MDPRLEYLQRRVAEARSDFHEAVEHYFVVWLLGDEQELAYATKAVLEKVKQYDQAMDELIAYLLQS